MLETDKFRLKKGDYLILLVVLIALVVMLIMISGNQQGNQVHITADGITKTYSLSDKQRIRIPKSKDSTGEQVDIGNTIVIDNGQVYMEDADCPDQVCVHHKPISKNGETIICLPNQVFVEVENDIENEIDN